MRNSLIKDYRLLPKNYEAARRHMLVVDSLKIKALPQIGRNVGLRNELKNPYDIAKKTIILAKKRITQGETMVYIDKIKPHALYELMLLSGGRKKIAGFQSHSAKFQTFLFEQIAKFAKFAHDQHITPVASWSYDPNTHDRESLQHEKRFHVHLVCRRTRGIKYIKTHSVHFRDLGIDRQRRICDESTLLISEVARDILKTKTLKAIAIVPAGREPLSRVMLKVKIHMGWQAFTNPILPKEIAEVERLLNHIQLTLRKGVTTGKIGFWKRPKLKSTKQIHAFIKKNSLGLSERTRALLKHFYNQLQNQPRIEDNHAADMTRDALTYLYPLAGSAHSVTLTENKNNVYAYFRPALYSDLGGAGVCIINDTIVKLKKGVSTFSKKEVGKRKFFQKTLLAALNS